MTAVPPARDSGAASKPGAEPVVLDAVALARLAELDPTGRHGVVTRVLGAFDTSLTRMLAQLASGANAPDAAVLAAVAHTLKSSSASVGALRLAALCEDVERRARAAGGAARPGEGGATAQRHDVERLLAEGEAALAAVKAMLRV